MKTKSKAKFLPRIQRSMLVGAGRRERIKLSPNSKMFYIACGLFVVGIAVGAILVSIDDLILLEYLSYLTKTGLESRVTSTISATFINCLIPHLVMMVLCWMFANCTFGMPFILFLIVFKGASAGLMGGYIYRYSAGMGTLYNVFITMPPTLVAAVGFLWLSVYSIKSSVTLYAIAVKGSARKISQTSAEVYHSLAVAGILSCASALLESILFKVFGGFFL